MTRLTKSIKEDLAHKLVNERFDNEFEKLKEVEHALAEKIYNNYYGKYEDIINQLPEYFRAYEVSYIKVRDYNGYYAYLDLPEAHSVIVRDITFSDILTEEERLEIGKYLRKSEDLGVSKKDLYIEVLGALSNINTSKKLLETWPEAHAKLDIKDKEPVSLAIPRDMLNAKLGL